MIRRLSSFDNQAYFCIVQRRHTAIPSCLTSDVAMSEEIKIHPDNSRACLTIPRNYEKYAFTLWENGNTNRQEVSIPSKHQSIWGIDILSSDI